MPTCHVLLQGLPKSALVSWLSARSASLSASYGAPADASEAAGRDLHFADLHRTPLYACLSVHLSVCLDVCLSVCLWVHLSVCLPVCLPACPRACKILGINPKQAFACTARFMSKCCISSVRVACCRKAHKSQCKELTKQQLRVDISLRGLRGNSIHRATQALAKRQGTSLPASSQIKTRIKVDHERLFNVKIQVCLLTATSSLPLLSYHQV